MNELENRRKQSVSRFDEFKALLDRSSSLVAGKACVYATGSYGRVEASGHSDLDLFIVGKNDGRPGRDGVEGSLLRLLDEILVKADLIDAARRLHFQEFSGDGKYVTHYSSHRLTKTLGRPDDDAANTLTARLLLLLESRPIIGEENYNDVLGDVITAYWRDYEDHKNNFMPAFLTNDILRLWRTFCVNYEARTETTPEKAKAKRKLTNYKLKHSRLLTCYSAILYLLALFGLNGTVSPSEAVEMVHLSPTERLEWLEQQPEFADAADTVRSILHLYGLFLERTNRSESEQVDMFLDRRASSEYSAEAGRFGDLMFNILNLVGKNGPFHRLLVV